MDRYCFVNHDIFLATSGIGEESGVFFSLIFFCGVPLYILGSFCFMAMKYRGPFLVGFAIPLAIIIPISIMSYYNEVENGCIFLGFQGNQDALQIRQAMVFLVVCFS